MRSDQVRWLSAGVKMPPEVRRWRPKSTLVAAPASKSAGLRVAVVAGVGKGGFDDGVWRGHEGPECAAEE
jgi:hypothetical protein